MFLDFQVSGKNHSSKNFNEENKNKKPSIFIKGFLKVKQILK